MRKQPRQKTGKYKHSGWYSFKKKKRGWREYAVHPITVSVFGLLSYLGVHTAWAFDESGKLNKKFEIYNFTNDPLKFRDSVDHPTLSGTASEDTGTPVSAGVEVKPQESGEASTPSVEYAPSSVEAKILKAWEGTGKGNIALAIAKGESGLRPDAVGDRHIQFWSGGKLMGHSCGIFQVRVLPGRPDCETLKDPDKNIEFARKLYDRSGFQPWTVFTKGIYLKYL